MGTEPDNDEDFCVECSDEEKYNSCLGEKGVWEPKPEDIKEMYEKLANGDTLNLTWVNPGRRSPSPEKIESETAEEEPKEEEKTEEKLAPTEFDFDEMSVPEVSTTITPRRTPGSTKTPRPQKKVATLDKILNDISRHKKMERKEKIKSSPGSAGDTTPKRPLAKLKLKEAEDEFS